MGMNSLIWSKWFDTSICICGIDPLQFRHITIAGISFLISTGPLFLNIIGSINSLAMIFLVEYHLDRQNSTTDAFSQRDEDVLALHAISVPKFLWFDELRQELVSSPAMVDLCACVHAWIGGGCVVLHRRFAII